jgi:hypothetical protein
MTDVIAVFGSAATSFAALVRRIPSFEVPGLGEWDMRALVGHASRSLVTVSTYLQHAADSQDIGSAAEYYAQMRDYAANLGAADVVERGRQAGRDLGDDPAATVDALVERVLGELGGVGDPLIAVIGGLGIRLSAYLPTRVFELAVHGLDIARAAGIDADLPDDVLADALGLATDIALLTGSGEQLLLALTGRLPLPAEFSVV